MPGVSRIGAGEFVCAVCGVYGTKQCSGCKAVRYCSAKCQSQHWNSGHKRTCKDTQHGRKASGFGGSSFTRIALVPASSKTLKQIKKILFPYDEFVKIFNSDNLGFPPRGLFNCGNSCFANVVIQCLRHTRPLVAYLMEKGHRQRCSRNDWCFLCEFQTHLERAVTTAHPFSPISIFSHLPNIGGNLGYGNQEDAHEFMRLAIDTMQSLCLDEFGGENAIHPSSQETTLIQHIFGGHLQSQVICTKCNMISNQYENMMDLTVEIQGNCSSLEECLEKYTLREYLHGDNMYKCDGCNDYVKAWKRLSVRQAPNIVTIALKRFETGRFGKLNKRVTFPERLDLGPYMTRPANGTDIYKLYAVVVHVDMLNASFFGHYICYVKDFRGYWFRVDDSKVVEVDLEDVLSQGAYMLLYSRLNARPSCLEPIEALKKDEPQIVDIVQEIASFNKPDGFGANENLHDHIGQGDPTDNNSHIPVSHFDEKLRLGSLTECVRGVEMTNTGLNSGSPRESQLCSSGHFNSRKNDASLTETSTSYIYDDDDDKFSHMFATEDVLQNWSDISMATHNDLCNKAKLCDGFFLKSSTLSSNDFLLSYSQEREQQICEEGLQEPSCPEDNTTKKSTWDDSTSKPVFSPVLPGMDSRFMSRKRNMNSLLESGELYLDNSADTASPKQKMDDKKIQ